MKDGKFELLSRINDEDISSRFFPTKEIGTMCEIDRDLFCLDFR